jgi:two-component system, NtrC family, sensor kinase
MKISIRHQIIALMGALLLGALGTYLYLATSLFTSDKLTYLRDSNFELAGTLSEEVRSCAGTLADKVAYFGAAQALLREQGASDQDHAARALLGVDPDMLSFELWEQKEGAGFERRYRYDDPARLATLRLTPESLAAGEGSHPLSPERVQAERVVLQNISVLPDLDLLRVWATFAGGKRIAVVDMRPDRLQRIFSRQKLSEVWLVDGRGTVLVRSEGARVAPRADVSDSPLVQRAIGRKDARGAEELDTPRGPVIGAFSAVGLGGLAVIAQVPKIEASRSSRELSRRSVPFAIGVMIVALVASIFFSRRLTEPLNRLEKTMALISQGELGVEVPVTGQNEIGRLAFAFNRMSRELSQREAQLMEANAQLIQSEKLSALGELSAGLVHEVKNPMVGIVGFSELGAVTESMDEAKEYFGLIRADAQRANEILQSMLEFARPQQVHMSALDPNEVVQGALRLVAHQLHLAGVKVHTRYAEGLPRIQGNANKLRQVLVNLVMNAGHAMEAAAVKALYVSTSAGTKGGVLLEVRDTGAGMTNEVREGIFRPFFTTKPRGKGTGLGLSVSRGIVLQHRGEISVESELGQGTTFRILLPAATA